MFEVRNFDKGKTKDNGFGYWYCGVVLASCLLSAHKSSLSPERFRGVEGRRQHRSDMPDNCRGRNRASCRRDDSGEVCRNHCSCKGTICRFQGESAASRCTTEDYSTVGRTQRCGPVAPDEGGWQGRRYAREQMGEFSAISESSKQ